MSVYSLYFSPTGGTKKASDMVLSVFNVDTYIDLSKADTDYTKYVFSKGDICFISVPSFGGRVPHIVLERLEKMKVDRAYAVLVVCYGNRAYDDTLLELKNTVEKLGYFAVGAVTAVTEHSIVRKYANGRPDIKDKAVLEKYSRKLKDMFNFNGLKIISVPGKVPYKISNGVPFKPEVDGNCIGCRLCAKVCPVNAIDADKPFMTDKVKCITCMRCISVCPQNARSIDRKALSAVEEKLKNFCSDRKENEIFLGI